MLTPEQLAEMRARAEDATSGPWVLDVQDGSVWEGYTPMRQIAHCQSKPGAGMIHDRGQILANADFISNARDDIPALLEYVGELERAVKVAQNSYMQVQRDVLAILENDMIDERRIDEIRNIVGWVRWSNQ